MSSDLVVAALAGALILLVFGAVLYNRRFHQNLDSQEQARLLCRSAEQLFGIAKGITPYLDDQRVTKLLLTMANELLERAFHLCPDDAGVNRSMAQLNELVDALPRQLGVAELPLASEDRLAAVNLQFTETLRAVARAQRQEVLTPDESENLGHQLRWRQVIIGVDCHVNLAATATTRKDRASAREHYRQALLLLRKSTENLQRRNELMRDLRAALDALEDDTTTANLSEAGNRATQAD